MPSGWPPAGSTVEIVTPDRHVGHEVTGTAYPAYLGAFYRAGVRMTPDHRLTAVRRTADRRLEADLWNDYTRSTSQRVVDQVVVEHGSVPNDELYFELRDGSCNGGELDLDAFIAGRPQERVVNPAGTYRLFRVGDAVASRSIHCRDLRGPQDRAAALTVPGGRAALGACGRAKRT